MQRSLNAARRACGVALRFSRSGLGVCRSFHSTAATAGNSAPTAADTTAAAASRLPPLKPSQAYIVMPQLSPRMERGSVAQWLLSDGDELQPAQVFLHVRTSELTEDGSEYLLEVESHESGVLMRVLVQPDEEALLPVGTPLAVFEDPDWSAGDPPRGEFLWQAYVKEGALRKGSCAPTRSDEAAEEGGEETTAPAASCSKAKRSSKDKSTN